MPPEAIAAPPAFGLAAIPLDWRRALIRLALVWCSLIAAFLPDWLAMFEQWWNASTYNHILLVPAIVGWLIWLRAPQLVRLVPGPSRRGLPFLAAAVFVWVLGSFAGFDLLRQTGAVAMLPASALLLLGPRIFAALLFPFAYMAFLVPFGDELVPALQSITARITIWLVHATGVTASIDGVFIDTPAGLFEVAEACSGVKFLIAMIALGVLVGNICFKTWRRRIGFFALCVIVPILANGVRAWGTIFAAQYVGIEKAAGIDHLIYGWIFFALVIAAVMTLSWRFFDRAIDEPMIDADALAASPLLARLERAGQSDRAALAACLLLVGGGIGWAAAASALSAVLPAQVFLPEVPGWQRVDYQPQAAWQPLAGGADHRLLGRYQDAAGSQVDVFFALYASQAEGKEAGGFGQGALTADTDWSWASAGPAVADAKSDRLIAGGKVERLALTYYRSSSLLTGSNARLKLANIADRLLLRTRPTAMLILSAEQRKGHDAERELAAFRAAIGDPGPWMDRIAEPR
ncbi:MAG: exosortase A [Sphingomonadaceae bacterium]